MTRLGEPLTREPSLDPPDFRQVECAHCGDEFDIDARSQVELAWCDRCDPVLRMSHWELVDRVIDLEEQLEAAQERRLVDELEHERFVKP